MKFAVTLDVQEALYTAIGDADLTGLGPDLRSHYVVSDAHVERVDETTWEFEIEVEHRTGAPVRDEEIVNALIDYFDGELVVDIGSLEQR